MRGPRATAFLCAALIGCRGNGEAPADANLGDATPGGTTADTPAAVTGWTLVKLTVDGGDRPLLPGSTITLSVGENWTVSGHAGVNRYTGRAQTGDGGRLEWPDMFATTKMAGDPALMEQEQVFLEALRRTDRMLVEKDGVLFETEDGSVRLAFH